MTAPTTAMVTNGNAEPLSLAEFCTISNFVGEVVGTAVGMDVGDAVGLAVGCSVAPTGRVRVEIVHQLFVSQRTGW